MPALTTNKSDWTGESITVEWSADADGSLTWEQFGYKFTAKYHAWDDPEMAEIFKAPGYYEVFGDQWGDDHKLCTVYIEGKSACCSEGLESGYSREADGASPVEAAVASAVKLLCNII